MSCLYPCFKVLKNPTAALICQSKFDAAISFILGLCGLLKSCTVCWMHEREDLLWSSGIGGVGALVEYSIHCFDCLIVC